MSEKDPALALKDASKQGGLVASVAKFFEKPRGGGAAGWRAPDVVNSTESVQQADALFADVTRALERAAESTARLAPISAAAQVSRRIKTFEVLKQTRHESDTSTFDENPLIYGLLEKNVGKKMMGTDVHLQELTVRAEKKWKELRDLLEPLRTRLQTWIATVPAVEEEQAIEQQAGGNSAFNFDDGELMEEIDQASSEGEDAAGATAASLEAGGEAGGEAASSQSQLSATPTTPGTSATAVNPGTNVFSMYAFTPAQQLDSALAAAAPLAAADKQQTDGEKPMTPDKLPAAAELPGIEQPSTPTLPVEPPAAAPTGEKAAARPPAAEMQADEASSDDDSRAGLLTQTRGHCAPPSPAHTHCLSAGEKKKKKRKHNKKDKKHHKRHKDKRQHS